MLTGFAVLLRFHIKGFGGKLIDMRLALGKVLPAGHEEGEKRADKEHNVEQEMKEGNFHVAQHFADALPVRLRDGHTQQQNGGNEVHAHDPSHEHNEDASKHGAVGSVLHAEDLEALHQKSTKGRED